MAKQKLDVLRLDIPQTVTPYEGLTKTDRARFDAALDTHCICGDGAAALAAKEALRIGLSSCRGDGVTFLAMLRVVVDREQFAPELGNDVLPIVRSGSTKAAQVIGTPPGFPFRLNVPTKLPAPPTGPYAHDMIDWTTGALNVAAATLYGYTIGSVEWSIYVLLTSCQPPHALGYAELAARLGDKVSKARLKKALQSFLFVPLAPGAGAMRLDTETGKMWIERDAAASLHETAQHRIQ